MNDRTILIVCPDVPYPPINGPRLDTWEQIRFLKAAGWKPIVLVSRTADEPHQDVVSIPEIETYEVKRNPRWSLRESAETVKRVQDVIDACRPSVVLCEGAELAPLLAQIRLNEAVPWFRAIDFALAQMVETIRAVGWQRQLIYGAHYLGKLARIYQIERLMFRIADWVLHIGYADMIAMQRIYGNSTEKDWIPPLLERETLEIKAAKSPLDVVYVASNYQHVMGKPDAIIQEIAPTIEAHRPGHFRFHLIGNRQARVETRADVRWHGVVDDLAPLMREMDIACLPVKIGWGCKLKMVESLAYGLPVIGSPEVFRGIPDADKAGIVCRNVNEYIAALLRLTDPAERALVGHSGREMYIRWRKAGENRLVEALARVHK